MLFGRGPVVNINATGWVNPWVLHRVTCAFSSEINIILHELHSRKQWVYGSVADFCPLTLHPQMLPVRKGDGDSSWTAIALSKLLASA